MSDKLNNADIHWDENGQPISSQYDDVYFSRASGIEETRYVFLQQNHLPERWSQLPTDKSGCFTIAETGFGTGLNFLAAAELWLKVAPKNWRLHFVSVEKFPLNREDFQKALSLWPELATLAEELQANYPPQIPGFHRLHLANNRLQLTLLFGEAAEMFEQLAGSDHPLWQHSGHGKVDAWFLDGFAPSKNPDMWTEQLFSAMANLSDAGTTLATFTAAGIVRRGLQAVGFNIEKIPGFGHKREMVRGAMAEQISVEITPEELQPASYNGITEAPWYLNTNPLSNTQHAAVLGGGIAGCSVASALAKRGWHVTLIERHQQLANEASGNPQGIIYPKFSKQDSPLSRFGLYGLSYASRFYRPFWQHNELGQQCGVLLLPESEKQAKDFPLIAERFAHCPELLHGVGNLAMKQLSGLNLKAEQGLHCPNLGWVIPPKICAALASHPNINRVTAEIDTLEFEQNCWRLLDCQGNTVAESETVILAASHELAKFEQTAHLPLKRIRGQISQVAQTDSDVKLNTVICGKGYIAPALNGSYTLGATYNLRDECADVRDSDHQTNLTKLTETDPGISELLPKSTTNLQGRVGFRCTTPDYLPLVGPAPKADEMQQRFELLSKNARAHIPLPGKYYQGLYISAGYGSRGLSYAPIAAELLAAQICGETAPVERDLVKALSPARFLIRELKRG
ncbi:bifunctional tRNA (5-methylaminomethyl-2-thiouridine)(34)-methyltransferase MnmD/FAD-dependent 5-carboxymethylaminomethyl-2-thiouridine(34) oxidoreductase MnmC [Porticoccaceae bacterium LTM1]|nr:bifunctional tRNA (5-methylaminomethyl-2-thiouridine)(34)-methyltransferase MnmD/FAD-dependent 5-carboxymethylaminomethyl-2-thiouridine(34) oxidoreductase MnmC [Porticoccaceae bacterium LTM1]